MSDGPDRIDWPALVRQLRKTRGLTQEQLAHQLKVTFATVNAWENGRHRPLPALAARVKSLARRAGVEFPQVSRAPAPRARRPRKT